MIGIIVSIIILIIIIVIFVLCFYYSFLKKRSGCEDCLGCNKKCFVKDIDKMANKIRKNKKK